MREPEPIPVLPGGRRGIQHASTRRLVELKRRYEGVRADPDAAPALRAYAGAVVAEIVGELRGRNGKAVAA